MDWFPTIYYWEMQQENEVLKGKVRLIVMVETGIKWESNGSPTRLNLIVCE